MSQFNSRELRSYLNEYDDGARITAKRGISFKGDMIRAIYRHPDAGKGKPKRETRRMLTPSHVKALRGHFAAPVAKDGDALAKADPVGRLQGFRPPSLKALPYWPGDRLYVKEAVRRCSETDAAALYDADDIPAVADTWPWKPDRLAAMYMPRGLARGELLVTGVSCERLNEITETQAEAEGIEYDAGWPVLRWCVGDDTGTGRRTARQAYIGLWEHINGKGSWNDNPLVWRVEFEPVVWPAAYDDAVTAVIRAERAAWLRSGQAWCVRCGRPAVGWFKAHKLAHTVDELMCGSFRCGGGADKAVIGPGPEVMDVGG